MPETLQRVYTISEEVGHLTIILLKAYYVTLYSKCFRKMKWTEAECTVQYNDQSLIFQLTEVNKCSYVIFICFKTATISSIINSSLDLARIQDLTIFCLYN